MQHADEDFPPWFIFTPNYHKAHDSNCRACSPVTMQGMTIIENGHNQICTADKCAGEATDSTHATSENEWCSEQSTASDSDDMSRIPGKRPLFGQGQIKKSEGKGKREGTESTQCKDCHPKGRPGEGGPVGHGDTAFPAAGKEAGGGGRCDGKGSPGSPTPEALLRPLPPGPLPVTEVPPRPEFPRGDTKIGKQIVKPLKETNVT